MTYECSIHRKILQRVWKSCGASGFWVLQCPEPGCTYMKPDKHGPKISKKEINNRG